MPTKNHGSIEEMEGRAGVERSEPGRRAELSAGGALVAGRPPPLPGLPGGGLVERPVLSDDLIDELLGGARTAQEIAGPDELLGQLTRRLLERALEGRLLVGALTFEERDARTVLLPMEALETVAPDVTPHQLEQVAVRTGYSRFPVCRDERLDGYLHIKDVLEFEDVHRNRPIAESWIRPLADVMASDRLRSVLATMQRSRAHLARVTAADGLPGPRRRGTRGRLGGAGRRDPRRGSP